jgi:hypothetical protein
MAEFDPDAYLARQESKKERRGGFDPEAYLKKTEAESGLQTFGRSAASLADTALNAITGTLDYAAYPLARAYYGLTGNRTPEEAAALAQQQTTSPKDVIGRATGVAGTSGYENAPLRSIGSKVGEVINDNLVAPIAERTGIPEQDVANMLATAAVGAGPAANRAAGAVKPVVKGAADIGKSTYQGFTGQIAKPGEVPRPGQTPSSLQPLGPTYIPADVLEQWRSGNISTKQATEAALPTTGPESPLPQAAVSRLQGNVPYTGEGLKAYGEMLGRGYRDPYVLGAEAVSDYLLGGIPTVAKLGIKGYQGYKGIQAARQLENAGFTRMSPQEMRALQAGENIYMPTGPAIPQVAPMPPKGPAQVNAAAVGIAPPMTAAESGFTQQLNTMASGPVAPNLKTVPMVTVRTSSDAMNMLQNTGPTDFVKMSRQLPEAYQSKELTAALMKGSGDWSKGDKIYKVTSTPGGDLRLQVRNQNGQVIDERYVRSLK